jgi:hypothetical protein
MPSPAAFDGCLQNDPTSEIAARQHHHPHQMVPVASTILQTLAPQLGHGLTELRDRLEKYVIIRGWIDGTQIGMTKAARNTFSTFFACWQCSWVRNTFKNAFPTSTARW